MNRSKALALVQQKRRRWRSQESDMAIARRAERVFRVALVYLIFSPVFVGVANLSARPVFNLVAGTFLICSVVLFWMSRRFSQVLRVLLDAGADANPVA